MDRKCFRRVLSMAVMAGLLSGTRMASADVTLGGDLGEVGPYDPIFWTTATAAQIGIDPGTTGTITLDNNMALNSLTTLYSRSAYLGVNPGSTGTVLIKGGTWTNNGSIHVGELGSGTLNIYLGGVVNTYGLYASPADLLGRGTINTRGLVTDADLVFDATNGAAHVLNFGGRNGVFGALNLDLTGQFGAAPLGVGYKSTGSLSVTQGVAVTSSVGYLGYLAGSTGQATVTGSASTWTANGNFFVGNSGNGTLTISNGGHVSNVDAHIAASNGYNVSTDGSGNLILCQATVTGVGATWTNTGTLYVGVSANSGSAPGGALNVLTGGTVTAQSLNIGYGSSVNLHFTGNGMVVLGNAATTGSLTNNGTINLYADAFLPAGLYSPITEATGHTLTWTGSGTVNAIGGTWNDVTKTFNVPAATVLAAGVPDAVQTGDRLIFLSDLVIFHTAPVNQVGATFVNPANATTFTAEPMDATQTSGLNAALAAGDSILSAWNFTTDMTNVGEVRLSFDVGTSASTFQAWHYKDGFWTPYNPSDLTYDGNGIVSFTVSSFSGYAVTSVPEPTTLALLALAGLTILPRKRRT